MSSEVTISPNMNLPVPNVGTAPGPDWAQDINACLGAVDSHNHTNGQGVQIPTGGLNINSDLTFQSQNAINLRTVRFTSQASPITGATPDLDCLYVSGADLYYNDGNGNQVRITQSGSVSGSSGTITGLPSGTASAAFSSATGTFVFQQSTGTGANVDAAAYILRYPGSYPTPTGNYIAIEAPTALATGYSFVLPANVPSVTSLLTMSTGGLLSYSTVDNITLTGIGGAIGVANNGIGNAQLASGAVASANIASGAITTATIASNAVTPAKLSAANFSVGTSTGSFATSAGSGSPQATGSTATVTASGLRPIQVFTIANVGSNIASDTGGAIYIYKDGAQVCSMAIPPESASVGGLSGITWFDSAPTAGSHSYNIRGSYVGGGGATIIRSIQIVAIEM